MEKKFLFIIEVKPHILTHKMESCAFVVGQACMAKKKNKEECSLFPSPEQEEQNSIIFSNDVIQLKVGEVSNSELSTLSTLVLG